jgi:hypothetical protein
VVEGDENWGVRQSATVREYCGRKKCHIAYRDPHRLSTGVKALFIPSREAAGCRMNPAVDERRSAMAASQEKRQRMGALILDPKSSPAATGDQLNHPDFPLDDVLRPNFSAKRHKMRPPVVHPDYPFESALEIRYDIPNENPPRDHFIWIIYGSGGK